jgi:hypothetical protein
MPEEEFRKWLKTDSPIGLTWKELETAVQEVIPWAVLDSDNDGQIIIYTNLQLSPRDNLTEEFETYA